MEENKSKSYYQVLEIPIDASSDEVHQGYQRAKNAYSQDNLALYSLMSEDECNRILELIDEAYSIISDQEKRQLYDEARGIKRAPIEDSKAPIPQPESRHITAESLNKPSPTSEKNMVKIVANKRFALEYEIDSDLDKEIEQTTLFDGAFLKKVREYKNVELIRMADMTKVSKTYLRHIEEENTEGLPALVYVRGFVYQYAKCLKLNPDQVATSYLGHLKSAAEVEA